MSRRSNPGTGVRATVIRRSLLATLVLGAIAGAAASGLVAGPGRILHWAGFPAADSRLVTGLLVTGTAGAPVVYVTSSDPRQNNYQTGEQRPVDTNSGVVSRLTREGGRWTRTDMVRGLPRSEHDHATNGLALDERTQRLYVAQGGMTNMGAPSARFALAPEYALSSSILALDLPRLSRSPPYDLPTLDDETRAGAYDAGDPFGGNGGLNQAVIVPGGPVQLYATGLRNPYDVALTRAGRLYTVDNSPAWYWGGRPVVRAGRCSNEPREFGQYVPDTLYVVDEGFYGGQPNPTRSSRGVRFNASNPQSPIDRPRPRECLYTVGQSRSALATFDTSTNGLTEYTASNFGGGLSGDLVAASIDQRVYRIDLDPTGRRVIKVSPLAKIDGFPLDVVAQSDTAVFPGTIWVADWAMGNITVLEPRDRESTRYWRQLTSSGTMRQEVSYVRLGNRFYLAGGGRRQEAYDPATDTWSDVAPLPERLDHIQSVAVGGRIYYVGGLIGFPGPATGTVFIYDAAANSFTRGADMPRPRGAGGVAVHDGKIYYAGGMHGGKAVRWFDVYDPITDTWSRLPDMPVARDHFQAQVVGSRFFAIGGRDSKVDSIIGRNDAFDFDRGVWVTGLAPMPTPRAGYGSAIVDGEIVVLGGEGPSRTFGEVEAYNVRSDSWRALDPMPEPRHGIQVVACGGDVYVAAGGAAPYGDRPSNSNSVLITNPSRRCPLASAAGTATRQPDRAGFRKLTIEAGLANPTSLQFGPDGRLYVAELDGTIVVLSLHRTTEGKYEVLAREQINEIRRIPNHDDDGTLAVGWDTLIRGVAQEIGICCAFPRDVPPKVSASQPLPANGARGQTIFLRAGCGGCHSYAPSGSQALSGPSLDHLRGLPVDFIRQAITDPDATVVPGYPPGRMPPDYGNTLDAQQLADLIGFLREPTARG